LFSFEKSETLAAYARLYLKEEIHAEATVRNLPGFAELPAISGALSRPANQRDQYCSGCRGGAHYGVRIS